MTGSEWLKKIEAEVRDGGMLTAADGVALFQYLEQLHDFARGVCTNCVQCKQNRDRILRTGPEVPTP
jgi:hypothetical protein